MHPIEQLLGYSFTDSSLLMRALTHASANVDTPDEISDNQRLEFLGDAVLGLLIAEWVYRRYPDDQEGALARRQSALVCGPQLAAIAKQAGLADHLILAAGEEEAGGRDTPSNLEDACEALIGALYLDGGLEAARRFVERYWHEAIEQVSEPPKDAKTTLQEWAQGRALPLPAYQVIAATGPDHAPEFLIEVAVKGHPPARGSANSKKLAQQEAAAALLTTLGVL